MTSKERLIIDDVLDIQETEKYNSQFGKQRLQTPCVFSI